jgi:thiamine transport system ATP-binding protein
MLTVAGLGVDYDGVPALTGVDLTVADGEVVSVLGPSGSGKSTLLRAVAGLEPAARGTVGWDGRDLAGIPPHRRQMGLMFQDHSLFPHRDVLGNVVFGLRMQHVDRADAERRARELLDVVGLGGFEHRKVAELSGGEQQRVALARALAPAPRLLMLDEPLGSLDRPLRERLMVELRELFTGLSLTALYVTHDHDEAFALADRVAVMHAGGIEQVGTPVDVWRRPASEFVARFLGYNLTAAFGAGPAAVRPDGVGLAPDGPVGGIVEARAFRRDHFLLRVRVETGEGGGSAGRPRRSPSLRGRPGDAERLDVAVRGDDVPEVGAAVRLAVDPDALVRFGVGSETVRRAPESDPTPSIGGP